ncbi:MAG TPA: cytochrome b N-terminal domain-containing protein, partial [Acidimicrobiales bacterium]
MAKTPLTNRLVRWLDRRVGGARLARKTLDKVFPDHWSFLLGEVSLYCFIVLVLTGIYLSLFFSPSQASVTYAGSYPPLRGVEMSQAYESAIRISFDVRAGMVMRQMHHWAALLFIAAITAHLARIFFTGAFRRPRELNWIIGVTLLVLAMINGFAGYSLLDDQLSGTGLRIANAIILSVPLVGTW